MNTKNPLKKKLVKRIQENGPISYSEFHEAALTDPEHGYYMNQNVFNKQGDFTTAPEISQLFSELVGVWVLHFYESINLAANRPKTLIEFGAGTGAFMEGILNVHRQLGYLQNLRVVIAEVSPFLTKLQQKKINEFLAKHKILMSFDESPKLQRLYNKHADISIEWVRSWMDFVELEKAPPHNGHYVFLNNEFFDALPALKFKYNKGKWHEVLVDLRVENKPQILLSSETNLPKGPAGTDNVNFFHHNVFIDTLSHANSETVRKILRPEYRFQDRSGLIDQMEFEVSPLGVFKSPDDCQRPWRVHQSDQRRRPVHRLRKTSLVH
jgi:SAM-dependent MidA family methyltransferase